MKHYQLTITSKNKKSADNFFVFFSNNMILNFNIIKKYFQKKKKRNILTILKSPHVNKKAQEQFESRYFSKQINIHSTKNFQFLLLLKKIKTHLFPDIKIAVKFTINKNLSEKTKTDILNPYNFKLNCLGEKISQKNALNNIRSAKNYNFNQNKVLKNVKNLLKVFDLYGELIK